MKTCKANNKTFNRREVKIFYNLQHLKHCIYIEIHSIY